MRPTLNAGINPVLLGLRSSVAGREPDGRFVFTWPIWREPASLTAIRGLLGHPRLR